MNTRLVKWLLVISGSLASSILYSLDRPLVFGEPDDRVKYYGRSKFDQGFDLFAKVWTVPEGLGPNVNARSCVSCHSTPVPGGSGTSGSSLVMISSRAEIFSGSPVIQRFGVDSTGNLISIYKGTPQGVRKTPSLFGLGLLAAVPDSYLAQLADPADSDRDGISGRLPRIARGSGRFGWKSNFESIDAIVRAALEIELGLKVAGPNDMIDSGAEVSLESLDQLVTYIRLLGPPPRGSKSTQSVKGERLFMSIGCSRCHVQTLQAQIELETGRHDRVEINPYTDLLVHDMGTALGDGVQTSGAKETEFRTPPLWGIASTGPPYLHDGRAKDLQEAILWHGGEAAPHSTRFRELSGEEQQDMVVFLKSL